MTREWGAGAGRRHVRALAGLPALVGAMLVLGVGAGSAAAAAELTVDPVSNLNRDGTNTLAVSGTEFPTTGVYLGVTAVVNGTIVAGSTKWVHQPPPPISGTQVLLNPDGSFDTTLDVTRTFTATPGDVEVDCDETPCSVTVWPQHTNPTAENVIASTPISFEGAPAVPSLAANPTSGLDRDTPTTVSLGGANFALPGLYVGQIANVNGTLVTNGDAFRWVRIAALGGDGPTLLNPDGTFESSIDVTRTFEDGDGNTIDCADVQCSIVTWRQHTDPTPGTLFTSQTISFAKPKPDPKVTASPSKNLSADSPSTVQVDGKRFSTTPPGVYLGVSAQIGDRIVTAPQTAAKWVHTGASGPGQVNMNPDGSFSTTLEVSRTFADGDTTIDCAVVTCSITTWPAHTNPTPASVITRTPLQFKSPAPNPPTPPSPPTPPTPPVEPPVTPVQPPANNETPSQPVTPPAAPSRAELARSAATAARKVLGTTIRVDRSFKLGNTVVYVARRATRRTLRVTATRVEGSIAANNALRLMAVGCVTARCNVTVAQTIRIGTGRRARKIDRPRQSLVVSGGAAKAVTLRTTPAIRTALRRGRVVRLQVRITSRDSNGQRRTQTRTYRLRSGR